MRVVHCLPKSQDDSRNHEINKEINIKRIPSTAVRPIDEDFINQPIDFLKINPNELPRTPGFHDEDDLSIPLYRIIGKQISTEPFEGKNELLKIKEMLDKMEKQSKKHKQNHQIYRLPQYVPQTPIQYCPEKAFVERTRQKVITTLIPPHQQTHTTARPFPYHMFVQNVGVTIPNDLSSMRSTNLKKNQSLMSPTFSSK